MEFGLPFPVAGFGFDTAVAWGVGKGNVLGTWPLVWDSQVKTPSSQRFVEAFVKKYGKPPENQAWGDYLSTKHVAQAMNDIKSTDSTKVVEHLEKGAKFDILKTREGLLPRLGPSAHAADVHADVQAGGSGQGSLGSVHVVRTGARRRPESGNSRADENRERLHDADLMRSARRARCARLASVSRC